MGTTENKTMMMLTRWAPWRELNRAQEESSRLFEDRVASRSGEGPGRAAGGATRPRARGKVEERRARRLRAEEGRGKAQEHPGDGELNLARLDEADLGPSISTRS